MCKILLSIHPTYVEKIFSGEKRFEFRKLQTKRKPDTIIVYATAPVSKVVGEISVQDIHYLPTEELWSKTKDAAGIEKEFYDTYYENKTHALAYEIKSVTQFASPQSLENYGVKCAPQSFVYLD